MANPTFVVSTDRRTDGIWMHSGRVRVSGLLDSGALITLTLPDDWQALVARVEALEASAGGVNSLEDMTYGG